MLQVFGNLNKLLFLEDHQIKTAHVDLLGRPEELGVTLDGFDAVIFTAGSGGKTGDDMALLVRS